MKGITKILILLFFLVILILNPPFLWGKTISVRVDAGKDLGPPTKILNSSIWIQNLGNPGSSYIIEKFFKDNKPSVVQLSLPILQNTKDFEDFKETLKTHFSMPSSLSFINKAKEYNTLVIVGYDPCPMPEWLSSNPGNLNPITTSGENTIQSCSPPNDYKLWSDVVIYSLNYFLSLGLNNLGFYIGHEPNETWLGSERTLYMFYEYSVRAIKSFNKNIKVGGIGSWDYMATKSNCDNPRYTQEVSNMCIEDGGWADPDNEKLLKNFIEYVAQQNVPIDFINWHSFGTPPMEFLKQSEIIKGWLKDSGLENVNLYPSDWTYWGGPYPTDYLDTSESAAYIISSLYYMWKAGIDWHGHDFDVRDYGGREKAVIKARNNSNFIGDWSLFTWGGAIGGGIQKPMYNAFKAISMAIPEDNNEPLKVIATESTPESNVTAFATLTGNQKRISIILSNFVPEDTMRLKKYLLYDIDRQTGFLEEEKELILKSIKENKGNKKKMEDAILQCIKRLVSTLKDPKKIEALNFIAKVHESLNTKKDLSPILGASKELKYPETQKIANTIIGLMDAQKNPTQVQIHLTNIPFSGKAKVTTYTIDSTQSNACSFNKRTEPTRTTAPCGIGGAVDCAVWDAKEKAQKEGVQVVEDYLFSLGYTDKEVGFVKDSIQTCRKSKDVKECLNKLLRDTSFKFSYPLKKVKEDLRETFKRYNESYHTNYYRAIDEINNWNEVSLEDSEVVNRIGIQNNIYTISLNMEPNSVALVILNKEPEK
ncbi:MAG: hypothetical protein Q6358_15280 [Candidatus Brocadiales bacterium]|nr:hypothetical protein [Candidatus Brocadiales bacterium]